MRGPRFARPDVDRSAFAGFRFPPEVITVAVRWYLRYGLIPRHGAAAGQARRRRRPRHPVPVGAAIHAAARRPARPLRHATGDRWFVDATYVKVAGRWRYLYRAVDQYGQVIDVLLCEQRDTTAARASSPGRWPPGPVPVEVSTDKAGPAAGAGRACPGRRPRDRAVRQQSNRSRSWSVEGTAASDARAETVPFPPESPPAMRACRTSAAATTNSPWTSHRGSAWPQHSPSSHWPCDQHFLPTPTFAPSRWTQQVPRSCPGKPEERTQHPRQQGP